MVITTRAENNGLRPVPPSLGLQDAAAVALLVALVASCTGEPSASSAWAGTVDTLPNGAVRVSNPAQGLRGEDAPLRLEETLRIGSVDTEGPELFGEPMDLAVDGFGRIWVADRQAHEVRVFGPDGRWVRTVGREGEGPGEFASPEALRWGPEGHLWVIDQWNSRIAVFDTTGNHLADHRRMISSMSLPWRGVVMSDGSIVDPISQVVDGTMVPRLARWESGSSGLDTLSLPDFQQQVWVARSEHGISQATVAFTPSLVWQLMPDGVLWFGTGEPYRIVARDLTTGDTLRVIEKAYDPVPVTSQEKDSVIAGLDWFRRQGGRADASDIPDHKPAFQDFAVDDSGRLWVEVMVTADSLRDRRFDLFDAAGRYLGPMTSPVRLRNRPLVVGDDLYDFTEDEVGIRYVVRLRLREGESPP